jgi:putative transposase
VVDDFNSKVLLIEADMSLPTVRLVRFLGQVKETMGFLQMIKVENSPKFIAALLDDWCTQLNINEVFIQPGKPMQNGCVECCNGSIRQKFLNAYVFTSLKEIQRKA